MIDRNEATKTIKQALKRRSGKDWAVYGGRGTAWGWITITAPKARLVEYNYMSEADCQELADLLGEIRPVHQQGVSISPDKREFYVDRAVNGKPAPAPVSVPQQVNGPIWAIACNNLDVSQVKPIIREVTEPSFMAGQFALLNKNSTLAEYRQEVASGEYKTDRCRITHVVELTNDGWDIFTNTLLHSYGWLDGEGGHASDMEAPEGAPLYWQWPEHKQQEFKATCYRLALYVVAPDREPILVDPQGYSYARYVGIHPQEEISTEDEMMLQIAYSVF